ncbi:retrovirus-related pol polyprotein from transposon TNT 1-94 [Tanacetum coccineum]
MKPLTVLRNLPPTIGNQGLLIGDLLNPLKSGLTKETNMFQMSVHDYLKRSVWYLDSGYFRHMTGVKQYLHIYSKESGPKVVFGDKSSGDIKGYGLVNCNKITFTKVAYVNGLKHNLISISRLCDANFKVLFTKLKEPYSTKIIKLYLLLQEEEMYMSLICHLTMKKAMFVSLPKHPTVLTGFGIRDYLTSTSKLQDKTLKIENLNEVRVKDLRSDNGTEFRNQKLEEFCDEKGISKNFSSLYTPEQNGVAERRNRTMIEETRTISVIVKRHGKKAYDVFRGRSPDISYFHVFGYPVHIHNHRDHLGNFDVKADDGFFLGYSLGDEINFNENRSFPDNEFLVPRSKVSQRLGKDDYFTYVLTYDPLFTNNITIPDHVTPTSQNINSPIELPEFTIADDHPIHNELDDFESADNLKPAEVQDFIINKPISEAEPSPTIISASTKVFINPPVP